jgi:hypothetical protein
MPDGFMTCRPTRSFSAGVRPRVSGFGAVQVSQCAVVTWISLITMMTIAKRM